MRALRHAAQQGRKAAPGRGRVGTASQGGDQAMLRAKELLAAAPRFKCSPSPTEPVHSDRPLPQPGPGPGRRGSARWSCSATARRSVAGPATGPNKRPVISISIIIIIILIAPQPQDGSVAGPNGTWCGGMATPPSRRPTRGSRPSALQTAWSESLPVNMVLPYHASGLTSLPERHRSCRWPPAPPSPRCGGPTPLALELAATVATLNWPRPLPPPHLRLHSTASKPVGK